MNTISIIFLRINWPNFARLNSKDKSGQSQKYSERQCLPLPLIKSAYVCSEQMSKPFSARRKSHAIVDATISLSLYRCACLLHLWTVSEQLDEHIVVKLFSIRGSTHYSVICTWNGWKISGPQLEALMHVRRENFLAVSEERCKICAQDTCMQQW